MSDSPTLADQHQAIIDALSTQFADRIETVDAYRTDETDPINTPAILLELEEIGEGKDVGDGRVPLLCTWTAHCFLSFQTPSAELEIRNFAAEVFALVRDNRWGLSSVDAPTRLGCGPGQFRPGKRGYESWYINWTQTLYLGDSVWDVSGVVPSQIFLGFAPDIGAGHEPDYIEVPSV